MDFNINICNESMLSTPATHNDDSNSGAPYNASTSEFESDLVMVSTSSTVAITYVLVGTLGIVGNFFVIVVFASESKLRKSFVNLYIINQSCIDFIVSTTVIGLSDLNSKALNDGISGTIYCLFWQSRVLLFGFVVASTYNLLCLTVERYAGIVHPIWHRVHLSRNKVYASIVGVWTFGFLVNAIPKFLTTYVVDGQCAVFLSWASPLAKAMYGTFVFSLHVIIPLCVMIYSYTRIALVLQRKIDRISNMTSSANQSKEQKLAHGRNNTIKTLATVALCFVLCWSWNQVNFFRANLGVLVQDKTSNAYHASVLLLYTNCCVNPFIYAFKYQQFQVSLHLCIQIKGLK